MRELPRANLGGEEVADHFRENLQPLHEATDQKIRMERACTEGDLECDVTERVADNSHNHRGGDPYMCGRAAFCG
jgi:hypothetical protein